MNWQKLIDRIHKNVACPDVLIDPELGVCATDSVRLVIAKTPWAAGERRVVQWPSGAPSQRPFPNVLYILRNVAPWWKGTVPTDETREALRMFLMMKGPRKTKRRVYVDAREKTWMVSRTGDSPVCVTVPVTWERTEPVPEWLTLGYNPSYLLDFFDAVDEDTVNVELQGPNETSVFYTESIVYLLMPTNV